MRADDRENRTFLFAHALLLVIVLTGFARTFYLQPWFALNPLDAPLVVHGAVLTCWFALVFAQALLAARGRRARHRQFAWLAAVIVPAVIACSAWINTRVAGRIQSAADPENMFVWGNYMSLVAFAGLVAAAVALRRRPEAHRRLLLLASIAIIGPAFARLAFWPMIGLGIAGAPPFAIGGMVLSLATVIAYDLRSRGRVLGATKAGAAAIVATLVFAVVIAQSGAGYAVMHGSKAAAASAARH